MEDTDDRQECLEGFAARGLEVGRRYRITLNDCCIKGSFEGTFLSYDPDNDRALFDQVSIGPHWGLWRADPLD